MPGQPLCHGVTPSAGKQRTKAEPTQEGKRSRAVWCEQLRGRVRASQELGCVGRLADERHGDVARAGGLRGEESDRRARGGSGGLRRRAAAVGWLVLQVRAQEQRHAHVEGEERTEVRNVWRQVGTRRGEPSAVGDVSVLQSAAWKKRTGIRSGRFTIAPSSTEVWRSRAATIAKRSASEPAW